MMLYRLRCMRLTLVFCRRPLGRRAGGSAVRLPQRSLRSEDNRTAEAALPLEQGSGRLAGRGLAGVFPQGGSGPRLVGLGCVVVPGCRCRKADGMERVRVAAF